jgi:hypothetical protein
MPNNIEIVVSALHDFYQTLDRALEALRKGGVPVDAAARIFPEPPALPLGRISLSDPADKPRAIIILAGIGIEVR